MLRIAVVGGGLMGTGLAQLFAVRGHPVTVVEPLEEARAQLPGRLRAICESMQQDAACLERVSAAEDLRAGVEGADFVIEAAPEHIELKQALFVEMAAAAPGGAVLATNSSVIPVGTIAAQLEDADAARVIGTHFWNPPYLIPLVEVIQGPRSGAGAIDRAMQLLRDAGKTPVHLRRDVVAGNRLQHALWREAMALVEEGVCDAAGVDAIVKSSFGLRLPVLGPLENADLVGLDLTCSVHEVVFPTLSRSTVPIPVLTRLLGAGHLGMRTGRGFHAWTAESAAAVRAHLTAHLQKLLA